MSVETNPAPNSNPNSASNSNPGARRRRTIAGVVGFVGTVAVVGFFALRSFTSLGEKVPAPFSLPDRPSSTTSAVVHVPQSLTQENS
jgi:hypothetical protein